VAPFARQLDRAWRRTSYTGITVADDRDSVGSEPEQPGITDEPDDAHRQAGGPTARATGGGLPVEIDTEQAGLRAVGSPWADIPRGAEIGTFVHAVLERVDFTAADLTAAVTAAVLEEQRRRGTDIGSPERLSAGLVAALSTSLGPLAGGRSLRAFGPADRLDELRFELPLAGGDHPSGHVLTADIARIFGASLGPGTGLEGYTARLASPALATRLRGYLTGSLDLVLRTTGASGAPHYLVVDYKTNWLGPAEEPLTAWHYRPDALVAEMQRDHYPLQAILYLVAMHRYLRWRLPGYDPEVHLGGVLYLFLRGMCDPAAPPAGGLPCGVFSWRTPPALVTGLSDLLDQGSRSS
jgi:exodeoxyribonuclease V beta subunit